MYSGTKLSNDGHQPIPEFRFEIYDDLISAEASPYRRQIALQSLLSAIADLELRLSTLSSLKVFLEKGDIGHLWSPLTNLTQIAESMFSRFNHCLSPAISNYVSFSMYMATVNHLCLRTMASKPEGEPILQNLALCPDYAEEDGEGEEKSSVLSELMSEVVNGSEKADSWGHECGKVLEELINIHELLIAQLGAVEDQILDYTRTRKMSEASEIVEPTSEAPAPTANQV